MKTIRGWDNKIVYLHRDKNLLAYMGKRKKLVRVLTTTESGAVAQCELVDKPGVVFMPLIEGGKNVEDFEILGNQLSWF